MSSSFLRNHVARYIAECEEYWDLRGVPGHRIALIKAEMEPSLNEALSRGLPLEDKFGPAQEWAECQYRTYIKETRTSRLRHHRIRQALYFSLLPILLALFPQHFLHSVLTFPLTGAAVATIAFIAISVQVSLLPRWKRLVFSHPRSNEGSLPRHSKDKGLLSNRYFWHALAGALASQIVPIQDIGEASSGFMAWSWLHTLVLLFATVIAGLVFHKLDPTRPMARTWDLEKSLGLQSNSKAAWKQERRFERVLIIISTISVFFLGCGWLLTPPNAREAAGLWLTLGFYWLIYLSYVYLLGERTKVRATD